MVGTHSTNLYSAVTSTLLAARFSALGDVASTTSSRTSNISLSNLKVSVRRKSVL